MFGGPGTAYVYLVYGMHDCLNIVTGPDRTPSAVLVRAVEPLEGFAEMRAARAERAVARRRLPDAASRRTAAAARLARLADVRLGCGPGLVTAAFGIDRSHDGLDLLDPASSFRLEPGSLPRRTRVVAGPRVGVGYAAEPWRSIAWRFAIAGHPSVSRPVG